MGIEPKLTALQSLRNVVFRQTPTAACDWRANFRIMRGAAGPRGTTVPLTIGFLLTTAATGVNEENLDREIRSVSAQSADFVASYFASYGAIIDADDLESSMRTTVTLDDDLLAKAVKLTGGLDRSAVLREGLKALIERESAARLAKLGGTQPKLESVPRRRAAAAT